MRPTAFEVSPVGGIKQGAGSSVASDNNIDIHIHAPLPGSKPVSDSDPRCKGWAAQGLCLGAFEKIGNVAAACPVSCANQTSSCYCRVFDVPPIGPPVGDQCPCADGTSGITIQGRCMCSRVVGYPADQPCPCGASPLAPTPFPTAVLPPTAYPTGAAPTPYPSASPTQTTPAPTPASPPTFGGTCPNGQVVEKPEDRSCPDQCASCAAGFELACHKCERCPAGTFSADGSACVPCPVGQWSAGGAERCEAKLKGSIGEGSNHSNFSHQSSVQILSNFQNSVY